MYCDCPYFDSGFACKHVAAVMFEYMKRHAKKSPHSDIKIDIDFLKSHIRRIRRQYLGHDGFVGYYRARNYLAEMSSFIESETYTLIDQGEFSDAFDLSWFIFDRFCHTPMDDDGEFIEMSDIVECAWQRIYDESDSSMKQKMFRLFLKKLQAFDVDEIMSAAIEDLLLANFNESDELAEKIRLCDKMIESAEKSENEFRLIKWELCKAEILKRTASDEEIESFYLAKQTDRLRLSYVDWLIEKERYEDAIKLLKDLLSSDIAYFGQCQIRLKDIYQFQGNIPAQKEVLLSMIHNMSSAGDDLFIELKKLYPKEEWEQEKAKVIKSMPDTVDKLYYYTKEKLYQDALRELKRKSNLSSLQMYGLKIAKKYRAEVIEIYRRVLGAQAERCAGRPHYQELVWHLYRLCKIDGGEKVARELAEEWCAKYQKRRAMIDELSDFLAQISE